MENVPNVFFTRNQSRTAQIQEIIYGKISSERSVAKENIKIMFMRLYYYEIRLDYAWELGNNTVLMYLQGVYLQKD